MKASLYAVLACTALSVAGGAHAATVIADGAPSGSILDEFDVFGPSGVKSMTFAATITEADDAPALLGQELRITTNPVSMDIDNTIEVSLGDASITGFDVTPGGSFDFDPFQPTAAGGAIYFSAFLFTPYDAVIEDPDDPMLDMFTLSEPWTQFGPSIGFPETELVISIFFDGVFPTLNYQEFDEEGELIFETDYVEGPLNVTRIAIGNDRALPPPPPPVPLPAPVLLLGAALFSLGALRRRAR